MANRPSLSASGCAVVITLLASSFTTVLTRDAPTSTDTVPGFNHSAYHDLQTIYSYMNSLPSESDLASVYSAATTYEGNDILVLRVSAVGDDSLPVVWIDCGMHGIEWIGPATCMWIIENLLNGYGADEQVTTLLNEFNFHIMPVVNPDGYDYTWTKDRLWIKNRVPDGDSLNCHGVNINRNFNISFGGYDSANRHCDDTYHGIEAFSEAESQGVRDALSNLHAMSGIKAYISIMAWGQKWMVPYGHIYEFPENMDEQLRVAEVGVKAIAELYGTQYEFGNAAIMHGGTSGTSSDWAYEVLGVPYSFSLLIRDQGLFGFFLPSQFILPTAEETWHGIAAALLATI
ncbi:unnamed protein product [Meganyctiphanes norvegica]|uniref:Peptidase M14 domain-containing protein n=1 Tax=Meganyctiphanes norvegica TaxID=48144 RepID=A0AAV2PQM9_MEGNR